MNELGNNPGKSWLCSTELLYKSLDKAVAASKQAYQEFCKRGLWN